MSSHIKNHRNKLTKNLFKEKENFVGCFGVFTVRLKQHENCALY